MSRHIWTESQVSQLSRLYADNAAADVAQAMGLTTAQIHYKAAQLGLAKSPEFKASEKSGRILRGQQNENMKANHFQPGFVPWNKGLTYQAGGRSKQTQFKPGAKPIGTMAVGSYRTTPDGTLERKTSETPGPNHLRWTPVARLVWAEAHGPIPPGCLIVFKPGKSTNVLELITPDRLECIARATLAQRNHPRNKSPELAKLYQLKGAITRQVNRINKESQT